MISFGNNKFKYKPKKKKPAPERKSLAWSKFQTDIFDFVRERDGHSMVIASPGAGKSTTILEALYHVPTQYRTGNKTLFTAFNSSIAKHLKEQVPDGVVAKTHHQLGFHTVLKHWGHTYNMSGFGSVDSDSYALLDLVKQQTGTSPDLWKLHESMQYCVDLSKSVLANSVDDITNVIADYGIELFGMEQEQFASSVWRIMERCRESPLILNGKSVITFADMIWLPYIHGWKPEQFSRVFVDEAQDLTPARIDLLLNSIAPGGRLCAVLDPFQCIYGFLGADENIHVKLQNDFNAHKLPLSVSYRCGYNIVNLAKTVNPEIEAANNAHPGQVDTIDTGAMQFVPGTAILSRANYPLVKLCMRLIASGIRANIQGRDIGNRLKWRIDVWRPNSVNELVASVNRWTDEMIERMTNKAGSQLVMDEAKCILNFAENANSVQEVKNNIDRFFSDEPTDIKLSSVHKAKGLEWDRVYMLNNTFHPERGGEESRIWYVAVTRAKNYLGIANGKI